MARLRQEAKNLEARLRNFDEEVVVCRGHVANEEASVAGARARRRDVEVENTCIMAELQASRAGNDREAACRVLRTRCRVIQRDIETVQAEMLAEASLMREGHAKTVRVLQTERMRSSLHLEDHRRYHQVFREDIQELEDASKTLLELGSQQSEHLAALRSQNDHLRQEEDSVSEDLRKLLAKYWNGVPMSGGGDPQHELERLECQAAANDLDIASLEKELSSEAGWLQVANSEVEMAAALAVAYCTNAEACEESVSSTTTTPDTSSIFFTSSYAASKHMDRAHTFSLSLHTPGQSHGSGPKRAWLRSPRTVTGLLRSPVEREGEDSLLMRERLEQERLRQEIAARARQPAASSHGCFSPAKEHPSRLDVSIIGQALPSVPSISDLGDKVFELGSPVVQPSAAQPSSANAPMEHWLLREQREQEALKQEIVLRAAQIERLNARLMPADDTDAMRMLQREEMEQHALRQEIALLAVRPSSLPMPPARSSSPTRGVDPLSGGMSSVALLTSHGVAASDETGLGGCSSATVADNSFSSRFGWRHAPWPERFAVAGPRLAVLGHGWREMGDASVAQVDSGAPYRFQPAQTLVA